MIVRRNVYSFDYRIFFSILVKAFLAKAKDEFQVKYDKPTQVIAINKIYHVLNTIFRIPPNPKTSTVFELLELVNKSTIDKLNS